MSNTAHGIIERLGGTRRVAACMGLSPSTVQSWKRAGFIPAPRQQDVLDAAGKLGVDLQPADFFAPVSVPAPARQVSA